MTTELAQLRRLSALLEDMGAASYAAHVVDAISEIERLRSDHGGASAGTSPLGRTLVEKVAGLSLERDFEPNGPDILEGYLSDTFTPDDVRACRLVS